MAWAGRVRKIAVMKFVSDILHRLPWWFVLLGGAGLFLAFVLYAIPFQIAELEHRGTTPQENRAIKSEINSAFSESALDMARGIVQEMRKLSTQNAQEIEAAVEEGRKRVEKLILEGKTYGVNV